MEKAIDDTLFGKGIEHIKKFVICNQILKVVFNSGKIDHNRYNELGAWLLTIGSNDSFSFSIGLNKFTI